MEIIEISRAKRLQKICNSDDMKRKLGHEDDSFEVLSPLPGDLPFITDYNRYAFN